MNSKKRHLKTANEEIVTKTQIALEAIKTYEMRTQSIIEKNKNQIHHPFQIVRTLEDRYDHLHYHKKLQIDKAVRVQLFPFSQDFYSVNAEQCLFPIRIILKNVRNETTIYVSYDIEFPGMPKHQFKEQSSECLNYDFKTTFKEDRMIVMKNPKKKQVKNMYITFTSDSELSMFCLKVDFIGYEGMDQQKSKSKTKRQTINAQPELMRIKTEGAQSLLPFTKNVRNSHNYVLGDKLAKKVVRKSLEKYEKKQFKNQKEIKLIKRETEKVYELDMGQKKNKIEELNMMKEQQKKKNSFLSSGLFNLKNTTHYLHNNSRSLHSLKRQKKGSIQVKVKANKEACQEFKQKNRIVRETANKFKRLISEYECNFKKCQQKSKQINNDVAGYFVAFLFINRANILYSRSARSIESAFMIKHFMQKFTKVLIKNQVNHVLQFPRQNIRLLMGPSHVIQINAKLFQKKSRIHAGKVVLSAFQILLPAITLNHVIEKSSRYRRLVRKVQRNWINKYRARLMMLQNFGTRHTRLMLKEYPHLKLGQRYFIQENVNHQLAYDYLHDESSKFKQIYTAYTLRVQQIEKFIQKNKEIVEENKKLPLNKQKQYLIVPKMPTPPQQRFFRNLDILKSMIRGWFELEYKKIIKKNMSKK